MRFTAARCLQAPKLPNHWRPLTPREIVTFPRYPQTFPESMSFYGVNALELTTQKPDYKFVKKVESVLTPWRKNSAHHKQLWKALYAQPAQDSNLKVDFKTSIAHNKTDEPFTKITFEDDSSLTLKAENLEFNYMMYIVIRELAERTMRAASLEDPKI